MASMHEWVNGRKCLVTVLLLVSCGPGGGSSHEEGADLKSGVEEAGSSPVEAGAEEGAEGRACLSECNPPKEVLVNFTSSVSLTPAGCTAADARVFDQGHGFYAVVLANCDGSPQVYGGSFDYAGQTVRPYALLSQRCIDERASTVSFQAAQGAHSTMVMFLCGSGNVTYTYNGIIVGDGGGVGTAVTLFTQAYPSYRAPSRYDVSWNAVAAVYGVAMTEKFVRVDEQGVKVGGTIAVPSAGDMARLTSYDGVWVYTQGHTGPANVSERGRCSKISSVGTLQCDQLYLDQSYISGRRFFTPGKWSVTASSAAEVYLANFDPLTCSQWNGKSIGRLNEERLTAVFDTVTLANGYLGLVYRGEGVGLQMAFIESKTGKIVSTTAITDGGEITAAQGLVVQGRIYVAVVRDQDLVLVVGGE